jgi:hypothetical protein
MGSRYKVSIPSDCDLSPESSSLCPIFKYAPFSNIGPLYCSPLFSRPGQLQVFPSSHVPAHPIFCCTWFVHLHALHTFGRQQFTHGMHWVSSYVHYPSIIQLHLRMSSWPVIVNVFSYCTTSYWGPLARFCNPIIYLSYTLEAPNVIDLSHISRVLQYVRLAEKVF